MSFWRRIFGVNNTGAGSRNDGEQITIPGAYAVAPAASVTLDTAMQVSAVFACTKLYAEIIGAMPLKVYEVRDGVWVEKADHPLAKLFRDRVNSWQTRPEFMETLIFNECLQGNSYSYKQYDSRGNVVGLVPLMSEQMQVALEKGEILYQYTDNGKQSLIPSKDIWQTKRFGNGVVGLSVLGYARNSIGIAQGAENTVSRVYSNGAKPSGGLFIDKPLTKDQREAVKQNFIDLESGTQDRLFVFEAGMKYQPISMTPQDIELMQSRRYQIEDIARFFGVPSVLINDTNASTVWGSGVEQIVQGFYKLSLRPYLSRLESSMESWLLSPSERASGNVKVRFDFDEFLQQSQADRVKMYKEAVTGGFMTPNEARRLEGWSDIDGGDEGYMQQQMIPLGMLGKVQQPMQKGALESKSSDQQHHITVNMPAISVQPSNVDIKTGAITIPSNIHLPEQNITITQPDIKQEAPIIHVAAPNVEVLAPDVKVDVAAPNVSVTPEVRVKMPKRKTKTSVKYDAADRITESTTIEEDA